MEHNPLTDRQTGYPSIDKPWMKYYTKDAVNEKIPSCSFYEYMYISNKDHCSEIALEYYGKKVTYEELFLKIDIIASSLIKLGVKEGDIISICSITTPEILCLFYAINKIGAIANMLDVRYTQAALKDYLKEAESELLFTLDICFPVIDDIVSETNIKKVIFLSAFNSMPAHTKTIIKTINFFQGKSINIPQDSCYLSWVDFESLSDKAMDINASFKDNSPAVIVHTGGTTGVPKGVLLTNENLNAVTVQIKNCHVDARRGFRYLNIMPPFIAYGIVLGLNAPITLGWYTIIVPRFEPDKFDDLILKYKPNGIMGVPTYWENVMSSSKIKGKDLSFITALLIGGDATSPEFEKRLDSFLQEHNCHAGVSKGYSMTEMGACATLSSKRANALGSVGVPLCKTIVSAFEPGTKNELPFGEVGEICIKSPTMMAGYYKNDEETERVKVCHDDGFWIHSGDLGYVDEEGLVYIKGRIKRMIIRSGFKVFPSEIENVFMTLEAVESCAVAGIPDKVDVTAPAVFVVVKKEFRGKEDWVLNELEILFDNSALPPYFKPVKYEFLENIPHTDIGKVDYRALEERI